MADIKQQKEETLGKIDGAMTALNIYPQNQLSHTNLSSNQSSNPFEFVIDILKNTAGYDWIINTVSQYIGKVLPVLEYGVKTILISNIRTMLSCSINPLINREMILNGVYFDLCQTDILNYLKHSPLDTTGNGKYCYFGCTPEDGINCIDDLMLADDFNAVLWYCKMNPGKRVVWRRKKDRNSENSQSWFNNKQQSKKNGIVTLEYNGRSSNLTTSEGEKMYIQEPLNDCLHVFIGNASGYGDQFEAEENIVLCNKILNEYNKYFKLLEDYLEDLDKSERNFNTSILEEHPNNCTEQLNNVKEGIYKDRQNIKRIKNCLTGIICLRVDDNGKEPGSEGYEETFLYPTAVEALQKLVNDKNGKQPGDVGYIYTERDNNEIDENWQFLKINYYFPDRKKEQRVIEELIPFNVLYDKNSNEITKKEIEKIKIKEEQKLTSSVVEYPTYNTNYYYCHALMEFNFDFVWSLQLYDEKVFTAALIDALLNGLLFWDFDIDIYQQALRNQIQNIIMRILETDDVEINDCFFSFSNDEFNDMLNITELHRMNLTTNSTNDINRFNVSAEEILSQLNNINPDSTPEERISVIEGSLNYILTHCNTTSEGDIPGMGSLNLLEQLLQKLIYVAACVLISPKVYIVLMTNIKLMNGRDTLDIAKFLQQFKDMLKEMFQRIRDNIMEFFYDRIKALIEQIMKQFSIQLSLEQYQMYIRLLGQCIHCFNNNKQDWIMDNVQYADIIEEAQEIINNNEC